MTLVACLGSTPLFCFFPPREKSLSQSSLLPPGVVGAGDRGPELSEGGAVTGWHKWAPIIQLIITVLQWRHFEHQTYLWQGRRAVHHEALGHLRHWRRLGLQTWLLERRRRSSVVWQRIWRIFNRSTGWSVYGWRLLWQHSLFFR